MIRTLGLALIPAVYAAVSHSISGVGDHKIGNAQALNPFHVSGASVGSIRKRHRPARIVGHAISMQEGQLLIESHLVKYQVRPLVRWQAGIHPGPVCLLSKRGDCRR